MLRRSDAFLQRGGLKVNVFLFVYPFPDADPLHGFGSAGDKAGSNVRPIVMNLDGKRVIR